MNILNMHTFRLLSIWGQHKNHFRKALFHWRRKKTKAKAKVVASVWGHTNVFNSLPRYSYCILSSAIHPIIKIVRSKIASAARNWINSVPLIEKRRPLLLLLSLSFFFGLIFRPPNLAFAGIQINLFNNSDENRNLLLLFLLLLDAIYVCLISWNSALSWVAQNSTFKRRPWQRGPFVNCLCLFNQWG